MDRREDAALLVFMRNHASEIADKLERLDAAEALLRLLHEKAKARRHSPDNGMVGWTLGTVDEYFARKDDRP